jgi:alpha(1,3/1,4) fucosyltransferase
MRFIKKQTGVIFFVIMFLLACFFHLKEPGNNIVYFYPGYFGFQPEETQDICLFGINLSELCRNKGLILKVVKSFDNLIYAKKIIVFELLNYNPEVINKYPKSKLSLFLWEPPTVIFHNFEKENHKYFSKIFTWDDSLVDNKRYFKFYYPELKNIEEKIKPFSEKKLCVMREDYRSSPHPKELYTERVDVVTFFENHAENQFDLFGMGWDQKRFKSFRNSNTNPEVFRFYKFSICYENTKDIDGYVTEKIFNSFKYLCVPVYLGAKNITDFVPGNCFIDRRKFRSNEELLAFLRNMSEEEYLKYQQNIRDFVTSEKAKNFTPQNFKKIFLEALK